MDTTIQRRLIGVIAGLGLLSSAALLHANRVSALETDWESDGVGTSTCDASCGSAQDFFLGAVRYNFPSYQANNFYAEFTNPDGSLGTAQIRGKAKCMKASGTSFVWQYTSWSDPEENQTANKVCPSDYPHLRSTLAYCKIWADDSCGAL